MRDFQFPGRSPLRVTEAAASTSHPLATTAAIETLKAGGNAIDAAIAAAAVLAVVEPQSTGIGGDGFMLYAPKGGGQVIAYNGSGRAPRRATVDWYLGQGFNAVPTYGVHAVTYPGLVDAWCRIHADHGSKPLDQLLQPAIRYAEEGYIVADRVAFDWAACAERFAAQANVDPVLFPGGRTPKAGEKMRDPRLAETLRKIAKQGRDGFYKGSVAEDIVSHLQGLGGLHEMEDFAATAGDYVEPISSTYRGAEIFQMPPNNQGITALLMLNILGGFDLGKLDPLSAERLHLEIEAGRLAYRDRNALLGDPRHGAIKSQEMLAKGHADQLRAAIQRDRAMTDLPAATLEHSDTVYLCVVDRDRNAVSLINSTYHSFGSGVVAPKSGVILQNRGSSFRLDPKHPNAIAPGKRPMHTIMPGMAVKDGRVWMPYGVMGGDYQPFGHVHLLTNIIDFGMDPQAALDCGRVFYDFGNVEVERGIPAAAADGLKQRGHAVVEAPEPLGGGQAIQIDHQSGTLTAGSDPRKDGCALGY
ncbi:gamma-glutamyltransferase [Dongia sedimenti]|uniref:Glutathione hydrolase proenzyme n=1 Tax=Dongia sedimenti TaxID=3064282 RepID=A0ABU0YIR4_9PROT|nr:gamma-glutamyltransferase [Rhodospirillaceae bacterium R-7]